MKILKKFLMPLCMVIAISGHAMDGSPIRLVFMGRTGAGKSTLINAFYNYARRVKWNDHPKHFPIPTPFQSCNVVEYQGRLAENHTQGQLGSVTQAPSEYISQGASFVVSMIDCPGGADTRGVAQDTANTILIADFMNQMGEFHAICIVLPISINRDTAETRYFIEELKTIIPKKAINRVLVCVTYSTAASDDIDRLVESAGFQKENIFYFDNYAMTKDGYGADLTVAIDAADEQTDNPFSVDESPSVAEQQKKVAGARKVRASWAYSFNEFNKMIKKAHSLGKYTAASMAKICRLKESISQNIAVMYQNIASIEERQEQSAAVRLQLKVAEESYNSASIHFHNISTEYSKRNQQLMAIINTANLNHIRSENIYLGNQVNLVVAMGLDVENKWQDKNNKDRKLLDIKFELKDLKDKRNTLQGEFFGNYIRLGSLSISGMNRYIDDYYDISIRNEQNAGERDKLLREKRLFMVLKKYYEEYDRSSLDSF